MQGNRRGIWKLILLYLSLGMVSLIILYPILLMLRISLISPEEFFRPDKALLIGPGWTLEHWKGVFGSGLLWPALYKSLYIATVTTVMAVLLAAPAAYVISRTGRRWKYILIMSLFISRMFPEVGIALPVSVRFLSWNLVDTYLGIVLAHLIKVLPYVAWILVGTFEAIPRSLEEASFVDGAGKLATLRRIVFPVSMPGIAVAAMLVWLESWNEFTYALYLTVSENTLPLQTYYYLNRGGIFNSAAYATIITVPVIVMTFILQRHLKAGMLAGGVK
ncbi:MAG: carbohydrate ABC transporter permease [Candidatus Wallbacteria bacterium]|nr:carbohydrate ABC transporter permease [Candidatus Wallbacteria bacterium]